MPLGVNQMNYQLTFLLAEFQDNLLFRRGT